MAYPQIIILNGVGSVGKTSVAKALQEVTSEPFLRVSMDAFLDMLPSSLTGHPDGMVFESVLEDAQPATAIRTGVVVERMMRGMRHAVAALASQSNRLIVDDVWLGQGEVDDYRRLLARYETRLVGLFAPLDVIEARERARGDRMLGLARWQYGRAHLGTTYDLEIDTTSITAQEAAGLIRRSFTL